MPTASREVVRVSNLTWTPFASAKPLLNNISFQLHAGERVLLVGPSGSGKSTLLRAIAGVLKDTEAGELVGSIEAPTSGLLLQDPNDSIVAPTILREVAFGPENLGYQSQEIASLASDSIHSVNLAKPLSGSSTDLSGGEMQRLSLAGVIAMRPDLLLLDEPTSMLDEFSAGAVREAVMKNLAEGCKTLILVEHRFDGWIEQMDRILVLNQDGELVFDGRPDQILGTHAQALLGLGIWVPGINSPKPSEVFLETNKVAGGSITVFTGNSGAGKTTELNRLIRQDKNAQSILTGVGLVPQQAELTIIGNSVFESAHYTAKIKAEKLGVDSKISEEHTRLLLQAMGLQDLQQQNPYEISGGEQRRLAIATALAHKPLTIYLDEPTVGQDRGAWSSIVGIILAARNAGMGVYLASHDSDLIALADKVISIEPTLESVVEAPKPVFSGLAIFAAPLMLLIGSMAVTSIVSGVAMLTVLAFAAIVFGFLGARFKSPKLVVAPLIGVASVGFSNWYLGASLHPGNGWIAALRVAAFVLPGVILAPQIRPYRLGDQLAQTVRLPARPVIAAMVALERIGFYLKMWNQIQFIHQIRGVTRGGNPISRLRHVGWVIFGLLVQAIRGAAATSVAMDARGFSRPPKTGIRTWAERPKWEKLDVALIASSVLVAAVPFLVR